VKFWYVTLTHVLRSWRFVDPTLFRTSDDQGWFLESKINLIVLIWIVCELSWCVVIRIHVMNIHHWSVFSWIHFDQRRWIYAWNLVPNLVFWICWNLKWANHLALYFFNPLLETKFGPCDFISHIVVWIL
jgi:hypothetical protein